MRSANAGPPSATVIWSAASRMVRPSSSIRQVGRFSFSPVPLIAATPFTVAVEDRRAHAEHAVGVLLVIGYFCSAAILIRDYSARSPSVEQVA